MLNEEKIETILFPVKNVEITTIMI